ncbi:hypothetical protein AKJ40_00795 [candidate division MSBL1 archaeon SCGC-AAA259M10]|uniref:Uncharacterized protein n=2 Tax=candidate division MSBL1 TaxID=215777 RepID=A0A133U855_9EURY|nr:hypothetical protein AKJ61_00880 [candidate division MSBL1 archaeon SCGC-AAA259B11]KXB00730.1 hypothetical protein AKJ40_00795 [candidate division MSBL1 archaeon SCGC-AAA259M10]
MSKEKVKEMPTSGTLERLTNDRGKHNPACHPPNSVRFKCQCGVVHKWPQNSRGHVYRCKNCGRKHGHQYGPWDYPSFGSKYGRNGCPGLGVYREKMESLLSEEEPE